MKKLIRLLCLPIGISIGLIIAALVSLCCILMWPIICSFGSVDEANDFAVAELICMADIFKNFKL